jgi:hypothetical protein
MDLITKLERLIEVENGESINRVEIYNVQNQIKIKKILSKIYAFNSSNQARQVSVIGSYIIPKFQDFLKENNIPNDLKLKLAELQNFYLNQMISIVSDDKGIENLISNIFIKELEELSNVQSVESIIELNRKSLEKFINEEKIKNGKRLEAAQRYLIEDRILESLNQVLSNSSLSYKAESHNEIVLLITRVKSIEKREMLGLITNEEYGVERNKCRLATIKLIKEFEDYAQQSAKRQ